MHSYLLFAAQFIAHLGLVALALLGDFNDWLICFAVYFLTGCLGMSVTFHRLLAHKSFRVHRSFKYLGLFFGTIGLTGSALAWASIHRQHHSAADREKDPHSPNVQTWWRVQFLSMYYKPNLRFCKDLLHDKVIVFFHRHYFLVNLLYASVLAIINPFWVISFYLAPAALLWHGGSMINTLGHKIGYRTFQLHDKSVNNPILGVLMFGEGWHNNHHAKPYKKSFSHFWWELDISAMVIRLVERRKLNASK